MTRATLMLAACILFSSTFLKRQHMHIAQTIWRLTKRTARLLFRFFILRLLVYFSIRCRFSHSRLMGAPEYPKTHTHTPRRLHSDCHWRTNEKLKFIWILLIVGWSNGEYENTHKKRVKRQFVICSHSNCTRSSLPPSFRLFVFDIVLYH